MTTVVAAASIYKSNAWGVERQQASAPFQAPTVAFKDGQLRKLFFLKPLGCEIPWLKQLDSHEFSRYESGSEFLRIQLREWSACAAGLNVDLFGFFGSFHDEVKTR